MPLTGKLRYTPYRFDVTADRLTWVETHPTCTELVRAQEENQIETPSPAFPTITQLGPEGVIEDLLVPDDSLLGPRLQPGSR